MFFKNYFIKIKFYLSLQNTHGSEKKLIQKKLFLTKSIFIFNGFTNLHGNLEIFEEDTRATLLIHAYDLFKNSKLVNFNRNMRIFLEKRNIKKNKNYG